MKTPKLTDSRVQRLVPRDKRFELFETLTPGFCVRVSPGGVKTFAFVYRFEGRPRRLTIGKFPILAVPTARGIARKASAAVADGKDPSAEKIAARQKPEPVTLAELADPSDVLNARNH